MKQRFRCVVCTVALVLQPLSTIPHKALLVVLREQ